MGAVWSSERMTLSPFASLKLSYGMEGIFSGAAPAATASAPARERRGLVMAPRYMLSEQAAPHIAGPQRALSSLHRLEPHPLGDDHDATFRDVKALAVLLEVVAYGGPRRNR